MLAIHNKRLRRRVRIDARPINKTKAEPEQEMIPVSGKIASAEKLGRDLILFNEDGTGVRIPNLVPEKGDKGDKGDSIQGNKGDKGDKGGSGKKGDKGIQGDKGGIGVGVAQLETVGRDLVVYLTDGNGYTLNNFIGKDGLDGIGGKDGKAGLKGKSGKKGKDGKGVDAVYREGNNLFCNMSDGSVSNLGKLPTGPAGKAGPKGKDAVKTVETIQTNASIKFEHDKERKRFRFIINKKPTEWVKLPRGGGGGGGGGSSTDHEYNFSFEEIQEEITIPQYQQMIVMGGILVEDSLILEGTLILEA